MQPAIEVYRESMSRVEHLGGLYKALDGLTTAAVDASDLLRAQIVLAVSAFDYYIHEVTVLGMVAVFEGKRPPTQAFLKYPVSVGAVSLGMTSPTSRWFEAEVRQHHSFLSFQQPDKVADAIRLFSDIKLWQEVALKMMVPEKTVKDQLKLIVDRRNKIAHEADLDPSYPGTRWPIHVADVEQSLQFLRKVCESIHASIL
jgi:RiboL-PSP-HEPN